MFFHFPHRRSRKSGALSAVVDFSSIGAGENPVWNGIAQILSIVQELNGRLSVDRAFRNPWQNFIIRPTANGGYDIEREFPGRVADVAHCASKDALAVQLESVLSPDRLARVLNSLVDKPLSVLNQSDAFGIFDSSRHSGFDFAPFKRTPLLINRQ